MEVALIIDAMAIKKHISWDYGAGDDPTEEATEVLCFMVVTFFKHWKLPIGYFLTRGLPGYCLSRLIVHALQSLHENGASVLTVTMDGHQANQAAMKQMGVTLKGTIRSTFKHPSDAAEEICGIFDPCHMIKLVRNTLHAYGESNELMIFINPVHVHVSATKIASA